MKLKKQFLTSCFACGITLSFLYLISASEAETIDYKRYENECIESGWQRLAVNVGGIERKILWNSPPVAWENGAIIVLHGGGGSATNWCAGVKATQPCIAFSKLALQEGFAVFALDSGDGLFSDEQGNSCGKRFICTAQGNKPNQDLAFIEAVITKVIPDLRPENSAQDIFIAGISNGGFMAILAATHFDDKITAFVPVSAGDPYGTHIVCNKDLTVRQGAPGLFYDNETKINIGEDDACVSESFPNEFEWKSENPARKPFFKQFHNEGDAGVDISCMKKARQLLIKHGYQDDGAYIIKNYGKKRLWKHFWLNEYNRPVIDFLKKCRQAR